MITDSAIAPGYAPKPPATTDTATVALALVTAGVLIVAVVINVIFGLRFPSNAPVEMIWNFGISVSMGACAIALIVRFVVIRSRPRAAAVASRGVSPLAVAALVLALVTLVGWLLVGGGDFLLKIASGERLRYYLDTNGAFFFGVPWMLSLFFGVAAYRPGRGRLTNGFSIAAIVISGLILVASLTSAVIYGLGLSD